MHDFSLLHVFSSVLCTVIQTCILFAASTLVVFHLFDSSLKENTSGSWTILGRLLSDVLNAVIIFVLTCDSRHCFKILIVLVCLLDENWLFIWNYWCNWLGRLALKITWMFRILSVPLHTGIMVKFPIDLAVVPGNTARTSVNTSTSPL